LYPDDADKQALAAEIMQRKARDSARTPMQWDHTPQAGFTSGEPWMRLNDDYASINAAAQVSNPIPQPGMLSVHAFWKRALECRKDNKEVFVYGDFEMLDMKHEKVVAFRRWSEKSAFVTVLNLSGESVSWEGMGELKVKKWVARNYDESELEKKARSGKVELRPWEAVLGMLE
jgi:oligo-1,6-glucosidase